MKVAVLISGEWRTFKHCVAHMPFLFDDRVDLYVSTWAETIYSSPKIDLQVTEEVTIERIYQELGGKIANMVVQNQTDFIEKRYNSRMIHRWITGFKNIVDSGNKYDYVIVVRPDLYFKYASDLDSIITDVLPNNLGVVWQNSIGAGRLSDTVLVSTFDTMSTIMGNLTVDEWANSNEDWHRWWYDYCSSKVQINSITAFEQCTFYRCIAQGSDYDRVMSYQHDWRDLRLLNKCDLFGRDLAGAAWPEAVLLNAERKWARGYYDKYKNYGKDNL